MGLVAKLTSDHRLTVSSIYESEPWGQSNQPRFLNAVIIGLFGMAPLSLLEQLKELEVMMGRPPLHPKWGPRIIDLDIIEAGGLVLNTPRLSIPHPHAHERAFVLVPLYEIAPQRAIDLSNRSLDGSSLVLRMPRKEVAQHLGEAFGVYCLDTPPVLPASKH
jgi:2-amino-4-hydroxy-6-hydroxymethyldihydropteridine diphosphokinase